MSKSTGRSIERGERFERIGSEGRDKYHIIYTGNGGREMNGKPNGGREERRGGDDGTEEIGLHLNDLPFGQMKSGAKTVELRLYDEKRRGIRVGDTIVFYRTGGTERIRARVKALHRAPTFERLFGMPGMLAKAGCAGMSSEEAVDFMRQFYPREREERYGVLGIELCGTEFSAE